MNIYIQNDLYNDKVYNNSGVAWYPNTSMTADNTARVVFNGAYLYDNSSNKEFSATLTHEFGHFFNLIHTFEGGCTGTDEVDDTPKEDGKHLLACNPGTNCTGDKVNIENYMGYNGAQGCYKMYTQGQVIRMLAALQHPARKSLWQPQNLVETGVNLTGSSLISSTNTFVEGAENNGSFGNNSSSISLEGSSKFYSNSGEMIAGTHYTHNFPAGITPTLILNADNQLTLTLKGNALNHSTENNVTSSITFLPSAFFNGSNPYCTSLNFNLKFASPYGIFFVNMPDALASELTPWTPFSIVKGDDTRYGAWRHLPKTLKIETYGKKLVCETGSRNISILNANVAVGPNSNMAAPGPHPDQLDIHTNTYNAWRGKTGYVGFEYLIDGAICYGWFKVNVAEDGDQFTITEYAYNTKPGAPIYTGMSDKTGVVLSKETMYESDENIGGITDTSVISLATNNATFTKNSGNLVAGTDYNITGVPAGLTALLTLKSNKQIEVSFTGVASSHLPSNNSSVTITLKDELVTGGISTLSSPVIILSIKFNEPYGVFFINNEDYIVSGASNWKYFDLGIGDDTTYGAWRYKLGHLKLETYEKKLVCESGTKNISLISEGIFIGPDSNFVAGGTNLDQLDLRTANYTVWDGKTGYVGFEYLKGGKTCYGWMHVKVDANGDGFTILDFAYNTKPNDPIMAGREAIGEVAAPSNLVGTVDFENLSATLNWSNNTNNGTSVVVERAGSDNIFTEIISLPISENTFTNTGLTANSTYQYRVLAKSPTVTSEYSNVVTLTIEKQGTLPIPTNLKNAGVYQTGFYAAWDTIAGIESYEVQLNTPNGWVTQGISNLYYLWIQRQGSQNTYEFRVRSLKGTEFSGWSQSHTVNLISLGNEEINTKAKSFNMYPNPTSDVLNFTFDKNVDLSKVQVHIYNFVGSLIKKFDRVSSLSVSNLPKGVYLVIVTDGKITESKKLIVK